MNEERVFRIEEQKLDLLRKRALYRGLRIVIPTMIISALFPFLASGEESITFLIFFTLILIPIGMIPVYIGTNKLKNRFKSYEIILTKEGVQLKAELTPWKKILWIDMIIQEKNNGSINLFDKHIPKNKRKFNGAGWILIQPEIENRNELLIELKKNCG